MKRLLPLLLLAGCAPCSPPAPEIDAATLDGAGGEPECGPCQGAPTCVMDYGKFCPSGWKASMFCDCNPDCRLVPGVSVSDPFCQGAGFGTQLYCCPSCACDCPDGPPPPPQVDTFCASAEDGAVCCFGTGTGICQNHECAP